MANYDATLKKLLIAIKNEVEKTANKRWSNKRDGVFECLDVKVDFDKRVNQKTMKELENRLNNNLGKKWANKEIKEQAKELKSMLEETTHIKTGRMRASWELTTPLSIANNGWTIQVKNTATDPRTGYKYPILEEERHHTMRTTFDNLFLPTVRTRMRDRLWRSKL